MTLAELAKQKIDNYTNNLATLKDFIRTESTFVANPTEDNQYLCVGITIPLTCDLTNVDNKLNFVLQNSTSLIQRRRLQRLPKKDVTY